MYDCYYGILIPHNYDNKSNNHMRWDNFSEFDGKILEKARRCDSNKLIVFLDHIWNVLQLIDTDITSVPFDPNSFISITKKHRYKFSVEDRDSARFPSELYKGALQPFNFLDIFTPKRYVNIKKGYNVGLTFDKYDRLMIVVELFYPNAKKSIPDQTIYDVNCRLRFVTERRPDGKYMLRVLSASKTQFSYIYVSKDHLDIINRVKWYMDSLPGDMCKFFEFYRNPVFRVKSPWEMWDFFDRIYTMRHFPDVKLGYRSDPNLCERVQPFYAQDLSI